MRASFVIVSFALSGCLQGGFFKQKNGAESLGAKETFVATTEIGGVSTATIDPNSRDIQVVKAAAGSSIKDVVVSFPPGSLGIATDVTLEEGSTLAAESTASALGVAAASLVSAGPSVVLESSAKIDPAQPFTVGLTISDAAGLALADQKIAILYQIKKYGEGGQVYFGVIPSSKVTVKGNQVFFEASFFGSFQPIQEVAAVQTVVEKKTEVPIVAAADVRAVGADELGYTATNLGTTAKYYWKVEAVDAAGTVVGVSETREFMTK